MTAPLTLAGSSPVHPAIAIGERRLPTTEWNAPTGELSEANEQNWWQMKWRGGRDSNPRPSA